MEAIDISAFVHAVARYEAYTVSIQRVIHMTVHKNFLLSETKLFSIGNHAIHKAKSAAASV